MTEFIPCRKCINKNGIHPLGYIVRQVPSADGKRKIEVVEECNCHKEWKAKITLQSAIQKANLPPDVINYDINSYVGTQSKANVDRLITFTNRSLSETESPDVKAKLAACCLYLYGPNGTQKTTLAFWIAYQFLKAKKSVKYILMNDLLKLLMKSERDEEIAGKIEKLSEVDLLIIDESFMKERVTIYRSGYQLSFIDTFLRNRIQSNKKGVIFISNINMDSIDRNLFGDGLVDLVKRNVLQSKGNMEFLDNYLDNMSKIDENALF